MHDVPHFPQVEAPLQGLGGAAGVGRRPRAFFSDNRSEANLMPTDSNSRPKRFALVAITLALTLSLSVYLSRHWCDGGH
jgi:hypothetical protein